MVWDYSRMAMGNLIHRKLRSWLTVLGILIGVMAIVSLVSLSQGLEKAISDEFSKFGVDKIIISPKTVGGPGTATEVILGEGDIDRIDRVLGVEVTTGALFRVGKVEVDDQLKYPFISGFDFERGVEIMEEYGFLDTIEGRTLRRGDTAAALVGYNVRYGTILEKPVRLGTRFMLEGKEFEIVGVLKKTGDPGYDAGVTVTIDAAEEAFGLNQTQYDAIYAKVNRGEDVAVIADRIKRSLRSYRNVDERKEDFTVQTSEDIARQLFAILDIISAVLVGIAAISLLVGGVGIMNTMYTAVLERTNEIGVMKAVGATNKDILTLFTLESGFLGTVGGAMGLLIGIGISKAIAFIGSAALGSALIRAVVPWYLIVGPLIFGFVLGAVSGVLPAYQAAKMRPVESLRY